MTASQISPSEHLPYYKKYIALVKEVPLVEALLQGQVDTISFFRAIPEEKLGFRYAEGKWSPKQVLLHLIDTERVFAYRALQFARSDNADLKGYDENIFAENSNADQRSLESLLEEYSAVRTASIHLFKSFDPTAMERFGKANGGPMSVRAAGYIICGHEIHHQNIVRERYLCSI